MLARYIFKNMRRSAVTNALFCLLLILAGALFTLAAGLWYSVYKSERNLEEIVTTIAVPDMYGVRRYAQTIVDKDDVSGFTDQWGTPLEDFREWFSNAESFQAFALRYVQMGLMNRISNDVYDSGLLETDDRRIYGAYVEGIRSVPVRLTESGNNSEFVINAPQSVAAFVVTCVGVEEVFQYASTYPNHSLNRAVVADFRVEQDIYVHHARFQTRTVTGYFPYMNPDGSLPVEEGKQYIVVGHSYTQGENTPGWYYAMPPKRPMPNALYIDLIGSGYDMVDVQEINAMYEFDDNILLFMVRFQLTENDFPVIKRDLIPAIDDELGFEGLSWFEMEGSLEDMLSSPRGEEIEAALSVAKISYNSLTVLTTNDMNSLLRFNQRTNKIIQGRALNARDLENGARVCVISEQLAELNGLAPGDKLALSMYPTKLGQVQTGNSDIAWLPSPYNPKLELTDPLEFQIVGIYSGISQEMRDYAIPPNTVIIPASSFEGMDGTAVSRLSSPYKPPLLSTVIVANDAIEETRDIIESLSEGYGNLFRFYDQGYSTFKPMLENLRFGMTWIAALAAIGWIIAVVMFSLFYIGRKKKETLLLTALGVSKYRSFSWIYIQCAIVIIIAQGIVVLLVSLLFGNILDTAISVATSFTESYRDFTLSELNIAGGLQISLPLENSRAGLILAAAGKTALLLGLSGWLCQRTTRSKTLAETRNAGE